MRKRQELPELSLKTKYSCLLTSFILANLSPPASLAMIIPAPSNKGNLHLEGYARLDSGAGPSTNDGTTGGAGSSANSPPDLNPVSLTNDSASSLEQSSGNKGAEGGVLKSTVSETGFAPHPENEQVLEEASVAESDSSRGKGKHKHKTAKSLVQQAKDVSVGPLPILNSDNDDKKAADFQNTAEKEQLADLWESTLTRSPDIQFVVQKLQPTSNQPHLASLLTKALSTAAFAGVGAMGMVSPNMGTYMMSSAGASAISSVLGGQQKKADKAAKLTQEEQMMMLQIVRSTADKLVASFRDYKKFFVSLSRASNDLQDLQAMASEARAGQDAAKQLEMDYTLRKAQRDIDQISDEVRRHRSNLIDLAGSEAVSKLDKQIIWEQTQVDQGQATASATVSNETPGGSAPAISAGNETPSAAAPAGSTGSDTAAAAAPSVSTGNETSPADAPIVSVTKETSATSSASFAVTDGTRPPNKSAKAQETINVNGSSKDGTRTASNLNPQS